MRRCVRCRKGHGDDEISGGETKQNQNEALAAPLWEQLLQHADAALPVRACFRNPGVDWQGTEQRHQHKNKSGDGREEAGGEEGDSRLVAESGEVVHARQAHHTPPRMNHVRLAVNTLGYADVGEEPVGERHARRYLAYARETCSRLSRRAIQNA